MNDYDIRGLDIDQRYAKFSRSPLSEQEHFNLGKASIVCPSPDGIGAALFLTSRSECEGFAEDIQKWALALGQHISQAMFKPPGRKRRRLYSEITDQNVIRQAALDGVAIAMFGIHYTPTLYERRVKFNVDERSYRKIRDFVGGCAVNLIANFRFALEWAWGYSTSREYDYLLRALSPEVLDQRGTYGLGEDVLNEKIPRPRRSEGNYLTPMRTSIPDDDLDNEHSEPHFIDDHNGYDERYAARMRAESLEDKSPQNTETLGEHETRGD